MRRKRQRVGWTCPAIDRVSDMLGRIEETGVHWAPIVADIRAELEVVRQENGDLRAEAKRVAAENARLRRRIEQLEKGEP